MTEQWSVESNGNGAFNACVEMSGCKSAALSNVSKDEAQAHVDRAVRFNADRDAKLELIDHLFSVENWKVATQYELVPDRALANQMKDALAFFCGGAEVRELSALGGEIAYVVGSKGYYHYVGA